MSMLTRNGRALGSTFALSAALAAAHLFVACGSDKLGPVSKFNGAECTKTKTCDEGGIKLDGGSTGTGPVDMSDASLPPQDPDGGGLADSGLSPSDGGLVADAGESDSGASVPDSGPLP